MIRIVALTLVCACSSSHSADDAPITIAEPPSPGIAPQTRLSARARPRGTLDVLSRPVAPGERTTQRLRLPQGWAIAGMCQMATDPETGALSPFVVETESSSTGAVGPGSYTIVARNVDKAPARLVCDVPYREVAATGDRKGSL